MVKEFEEDRMKRKRTSVIKDAIVYAKEDFGCELTISNNTFTFKYHEQQYEKVTEEKEVVKVVLKKIRNRKLIEETVNARWQGVLIKLREEDTELVKDKCYSWLQKWKDCPTYLINNLQSIYLQTVPTLTFINYRTPGADINDICRLCKNGRESIKHLLSSCKIFLSTGYVKRHDKALQYIMFHYLHKEKFIERCPPWYNKVNIKAYV